jgi:uncharacterized membrane protein YoaK (UPF0700 family)
VPTPSADTSVTSGGSRQAASRKESRRTALLLTLTFVTGVVDVVSYVGLDHIFVANMTGNVVLLGAALTSEARVPIRPIAGAFLGFFAGAALAGRVASRLRHPAGLHATLLLGLSSLLLLGTGLLAQFGAPSTLLPFVPIVALAVAMGLQGGWARAYAAPDLPTVVVTSTLVGLAFQSRLGSGESTRWQRRAAAVALLVAGGVAGGLLLRVGPIAALGACALITLVVAILACRDERSAAPT